VEACLNVLMEAEPPLVVRLPRAPGSREARVAHLLSGPPAEGCAPQAVESGAVRTSRLDQLEAEVATLRTELADLRQAFEAFRDQF